MDFHHAATMGVQHALRAHSRCVSDHFMSAKMVTAKLFGTIGMIQDHNIKSHVVLLESPPSLFE
jgi:hypothetical protein